MKTIYLVRHAKSDKGNPLLKDIDRPLNDRGYSDAYFMSSLMVKERHAPDILLSSPAIRAYSTALVFLKKFGFGTENLILHDGLYEEDTRNYADAIKSLPDKYDSVMLFAHNPTITEAANAFSEQPVNDFPTCGICCISFDIKKWKEISEKKGRQKFFYSPKNHL
jgi:phosphohistidine phosphatase